MIQKLFIYYYLSSSQMKLYDDKNERISEDIHL